MTQRLRVCASLGFQRFCAIDDGDVEGFCEFSVLVMLMVVMVVADGDCDVGGQV